MAKSRYSGVSCRKASLRTFSLSLLSLPLLIKSAASISAEAYRHAPTTGTLSKRNETAIPIVVENLCGETIWPGIGTQAGKGAGTGGFELKSGTKKELTVSPDWQGRIWGRTNCSFNAAGTGPSSNSGKACDSGDCAGVMSCVLTGETPVTLFEVALAGGINGKQTYYDISLVDGYNLPMGITYIPGASPELQKIPPNLTNCACIATEGFLTDGPTNGTFPMPWVEGITNADLGSWCPWPLQTNPPTKPGDGIYPYPDDGIKRPIFDPCLSNCAKTNAPEDCCTGSYNDPKVCKGGVFSVASKKVCPDAYSFAYDDTTSTFIIPTGGGWKVTFCPAGKSTNILKTFGPQLFELANSGKVSSQVLQDTQNITLVMKADGGTSVMGYGTDGERRKLGSLGALVVMLAWLCLW